MVLYKPQQMFDLVNDVTSYPRFLNWCVSGEIREDGQTERVATLGIALAGSRHRFTTRNRLEPPDAIHLELVEGPFKALEGHWRFTDIGGQGCRVALNLSFDFSSAVLKSAFGRAFGRIAQRLVNDFCTRADQVYGTAKR